MECILIFVLSKLVNNYFVIYYMHEENTYIYIIPVIIDSFTPLHQQLISINRIIMPNQHQLKIIYFYLVSFNQRKKSCRTKLEDWKEVRSLNLMD